MGLSIKRVRGRRWDLGRHFGVERERIRLLASCKSQVVRSAVVEGRDATITGSGQ